MYNRATLKNGIRVIYEYIPYVKSVSVGVWVGVGSRYETPANSGISHFIEHMLFKGTKKRSAKDIAEEMDFYGGQINAFTSKEYTCFYTKTLDTHLDLSVDLLSDMYYNSVFNPQDIETERKVIIEEINMYEDSPEDLVHDLLIEKAWDGDPLAMPISGTVESVSGITRDMILSYMDKFYTPQNTVIAVAGSFDEEKLIPLLEEKFNVLRPSYNLSPFSIPEFKGGIYKKQKNIEQAHIAIGFCGLPSKDKDIFPLAVINNILGGSMSSRLFQTIREEKGLAYSVYSYSASYKGCGLYTIYAGLNPDKVDLVCELIINEVQKLVKDGISDYELKKGKEQLKGNYILSLESISSRMSALGKSEVMGERCRTPEEVLALIDSVDEEYANRIIKNIFDAPSCTAIVSPK